MRIAYYLAYIAGNSFFALTTWKFYRAIFTRSKVSKGTELLCYALLFTTTIFLQQFATTEICFWGGLLSLALLSLPYQDYLAKKIFSVLSLFLFNSLIHYGLVIVSGRERLLLFNPSSFNALIGIALECVLFYLFYLCATLIQSCLENNTIAIVDWTAVFILPLCVLSLLCVSLVQSKSGFDFLFFFCVLLLAAVNLLALFVHGLRTVRTRLKLVSYQNIYYQNQLEIIEASESAYRSLRHDLKNHLLITFDSLNSGDVHRAKEYLASICAELDSPKALSKTGNSTIDSLLNYKLGNVRSSGIHLDCCAEIPSQLRIDAFDLTVILGNLLDNALEALEKLPTSAKKELSVKLRYDSGRLIIKIANTYDGFLRSTRKGFLTRKNDPSIHGVGLKNVRTTIEKYNGGFKITHDRTLFTAYVILYEPDL